LLEGFDMTDINKYNPYPEVCSIRCPNCRKEATFGFPFVFISGPERSREQRIAQYALPGHIMEAWGGWTVLINFPDLFPWKAPEHRTYRRGDIGGYSCIHCGSRGKHPLDWPQDAYYVCEVRGHTLWAWTRDYAETLRSYIGSKDRKKYPGYLLFLRHIPKVFLLAKNRDTVLKQLDRMLSA